MPDLQYLLHFNSLRILPVARCSPPLSAPAHGRISCTSSRSAAGSHCTFSCSPGYRLTGGTATRNCVLSGSTASWSGSNPNCIREYWWKSMDFFLHTFSCYCHKFLISAPFQFGHSNVNKIFPKFIHNITPIDRQCWMKCNGYCCCHGKL